MGVGSVSISDTTLDFIRSILPEGSTILEFGSGEGTVRLSEYYKMYSVENQTEWQDRFPDATTYINCDTKWYDDAFTVPEMSSQQRAWYDPDMLLGKLPKEYDLILIDGPGGQYGRGGFLKYLEHFNTDLPMIFDDANRPAELELMQKVSQIVNRPYALSETDPGLGYIL